MTVIDLKQQYLSHIAKLEQQKVPLASYCCPACDYLIKTHRPAAGDVYDTMTTCPNCEELYFMCVQSNGKVTLIHFGSAAA